MFLEGLSCQEAYYSCRNEVRLRHPEAADGSRTLESALADSSICPTLRQIRYRFSVFDTLTHGERNGPALWNHIDGVCSSYNKQHEQYSGKVQFISPVSRGSEFIIAVSTPIMTRIRQSFPEDCILSFIDSTGSVDTQALVVTFVLAATCVGALPIGLLISGEKTELAYEKGLPLLRDLTEEIDSSSRWSPAVVMTDNDAALRNGINSSFPHIRRLLCQFHVLQQVWRYLWSRTSEIAKENRVAIMLLFKACVYSDESNFEDHRRSLFLCQNLSTNSKGYFHDHFQSYPDWALHCRRKLPTRGHNTNNNAEISVRLFKEGIMHRMKSKSLGHPLPTCTSVLDAFYCSRLLDYAHQRSGLFHLYRKSSKEFYAGSGIPEGAYACVQANTFYVGPKTTSQFSHLI
jgi:hypothetical protein